MIHQPTNIWGRIISLPDDVNIGAFCDIGDPNIGDGCKIQTGVSIPPGWKIGNNVLIGPGARFANDKYPSVKNKKVMDLGVVEDDVSIGIGAIILPVRIGRGATVGAGAVVTRDVSPHATVIGNPARETFESLRREA